MAQDPGNSAAAGAGEDHALHTKVATKGSAFRRSLGLLATRRFGTFCLASLLSNMGTWAQQVAEPWLLLNIGAPSVLLGLDSFAAGAPVFVLTLFGGILADRRDRRRIITIFQSVQMLCPTTIVVLLLSGSVHAWVVIALSLVVGVTDALSMPSFQSIVPSIVEREQIPSAMALNATQFNLSRTPGPLFAGALMIAAGPVGCFAANAASYIPFIAVALWILPRRGGTVAARDRSDRPQLFAGARTIAREPGLRGALLTVVTTSILCGPLITFCPVLVRSAFHRDVAGFSLAVTTFGIGGLVGAITLLGIELERERRRICSRLALVLGAITALAAIDPWFWVLPLLLGLAGLAMTASNTSANALLQATSPARFRGQTASLYMLAMRGGLACGGLLTGVVVDWLGVRQALLLNGIATILLHTVLGRYWLRAPALARLA